MLSFIPLVQNENMKLYRRPRTWIMLGIMVLILILMVVIQKTDKPHVDSRKLDYETRLQNSIEASEKRLTDPNLSLDEGSRKLIEKDILIDKYALEHKLNITQENAWKTVMQSVNLINLLAIFTVVVAADSVAGEFSAGTIKVLLIRPVRRWKILLSKYVGSMLFAVFGMVILFAAALLIGGLAWGFDGAGVPHLFVQDGVVHERSMFLQSWLMYGYECISMVMIVTFAFMISSAFRSSSMAIGISIGLMFMGSLIVQLLMRFDWIKYFLFANLDLRMYLEDRPIIEGMTMGFSITMLLLYFAVFNSVAWLLFTKRDVGA